MSERLDWPLLLDTASRHYVLPLVASNLLSRECWPYEAGPLPHRQMLSFVYEGNRHRNTFLAAELQSIVKDFDNRGLWCCLRKGPVLIADVYRDPGVRPMMDIDLLADRADLPAVADVLGKRGYVIGKRAFGRGQIAQGSLDNYLYWREDANTEIPFRRQTNNRFAPVVAVDVCTDLFIPSVRHALPAGDLRLHTALTRVGDADVTVLDREAFLLDMCLHVAKEAAATSYRRRELDLRLMKICDIAEYITCYSVDWPRLLELCCRYGCVDEVVCGLEAALLVYPTSMTDRWTELIPVDEEGAPSVPNFRNLVRTQSFMLGVDGVP
jgi:hypothetical protein